MLSQEYDHDQHLHDQRIWPHSGNPTPVPTGLPRGAGGDVFDLCLVLEQDPGGSAHRRHWTLHWELIDLRDDRGGKDRGVAAWLKVGGFFGSMDQGSDRR